LVQLVALLLLSLLLSDLAALTWATVLAYAAAASFVVASFSRQWPRVEASGSRATTAADRFGLWELFQFSLPLTLVPVLNFGGQQADILLVGHYLQAADVGVYAAARRTAAIALVPLFAFGGITAATISKLFARNHQHAIRRLYEFVAKWVFVGSAVLFVILVVAAEDLLSLFGSEFVRGANALRVLAAGQLVNAAVGPSGNTLLMMGRERVVLLNSTVAAALGIFLGLLLIPRYEILGAAAAVAITLCAVNLLSVVELGALLGVYPGPVTAYAKRLMAVALCAAITFGLRLLVDGAVAGLLLTSACSLAVLPLLVVLGEGFSTEDSVIVKAVLGKARALGGR